MPHYQYTGRDRNGDKVEGVQEAQNPEGVAGLLQSKQVTPISIKEITEEKAQDSIKLSFTTRREVKPEELIIFCRQMAALSRSGLPILRSITGLAESQKSPFFSQMLSDVAKGLSTGQSLSQSMKIHEDVFGELVVNLIHVGETTGQLEEAFIRAVDHLELERETKKRIKKATRYPTIVMSAIVIAITVVNIWVIPNFAGVFAKLGSDMPLPTQILLATSNFMVEWIGTILAFLILGIAIFMRWKSTEEGAIKWDKTKLRFPIFGDILLRISMSKFTRTFAMLIKSGVPVLQSLHVVSTVVGNKYIGKTIEEMRQSIERGDSLTRTATNTDLFTPLVLQMMAVGEETGQVDKLLDHVADFYEEEVEYDLDTLSERMEPVILVAMGIMVLTLIMGIFMPILEIYNQFAGNK